MLKLGCRIARFLVLCLGFLATPGQAASAQPQVTGIALDTQGSATRLLVDLSQRTEYRVFFLNDPMRAVIDLPPVGWSVRSPAAPRGVVAGYRYGAFDPQTSRLVIDLASPAKVRSARYELMPAGKQRLVVELEAASAAEFANQIQPWTHSVTQPVNVVTAAPKISTPTAPAVAAPAPRLAAATPNPSAPRPRAVARRVVAIDPGHGGVDPGAIGVGGSFEKDVTLAVASELRKQLEATGHYKVVMTRDDDTFVRLRERIAKARSGDAELFISIHADSMRSHDARGASIYTLSENASDDEAAALAARENRSDIIAGVDLSRENKEVASILIDLAQRETMNFSVTFAGHLVTELGKEIALIPVRPHRYAGFAVLKAADMPSALVELGYLSNRQDEQMLTRPAQRAKVAGAIAKAIDRYFQKRPPPT